MAYYNGHYVFLPVSASVGYAEASGSIIDVADSVGGFAVDCTISNAGGFLKVTRYGKNMFGFGGRQVIDFGERPNTTPRTYVPDGIIVGFAGSNYYNGGELSDNVTYDKESDTYTVKGASWYGVGVAIPIEAGAAYHFFADEHSDNAKLVISYFDEQGNNINFANCNSTNYKSTAPTNAVWGVAMITSSDKTDATFTRVHLEKVAVKPEYAPYVDIQCVQMNYDGTVDGLTSTSDRMVITAMGTSDITTITARYANSFDGYKMEFLK